MTRSKEASKLAGVKTDAQHDVFQRLHQLVESTPDARGFLQGLTRHAADTLSRASGATIDCAVTLHRRKQTVLMAATTNTARLLDSAEQRIGDGPCLEALETSSPVVLPDTTTDRRWPDYSGYLARAGIRSALGVPLDLGKDASAALSFFAQQTGLFTNAVIEESRGFAEMASLALGLALRVTAAESRCTELKIEMETRTILGLACGVIMARNDCTQSEAFAHLLEASRTHNRRLKDVALDITANTSRGTTPTTFFED